MAAPSGTVWGSIVGGYGRVGIHVALTHTNTHTTRVITLWFWSKYGLSDSTNTLYYDAGTTNATSSKGSVSISTSVSSGSGWSTSNQVKLKTYSHTYARGTSDWGESCAMKLAGIDRVGGTMTATTKYTVPKLASYTVSYNANGGSGAPSAQTKYYGKNLTLSSTVPSKSGYTFLGWGTSSTSTSASYGSGATYSANAGITLYAIWRKTISIYYNANGNGASLGSITTQSVNVYNATTSASITLSNASGPSKSGYTFLGWSTNSGATSATYAKGVAYTFSSSVTLYAIWRKTITITYNANGGSYTGTTSVGYAYNNATSTNITITGTRPTKNGYTFLGWSTSPSATPSATNSSYNSSTAYTFSANTTLYAIWKKTITITYDSNGGIDTPTATSVDIYNSSTSADITLSSLVPTRIDYTFLGWSLYSDATTATYSSGAIATFTESKTLYAVWEVAYIKPTIYNVKVDRVDIDGNSADDGTFVAISFETKATEKITDVQIKYTIGGVENIDKPLFAVKQINDTSLTQNAVAWYASINNFILGTQLTETDEGVFSLDYEYTITIEVTDEIGSNTHDVTVESLNVQIDIGQNSVAIGKVSDGYKKFEVDYDSVFNKAVAIGGTPIQNRFTSYFPADFDEGLTSANFLGQNISEYSSSKIIIIPEINYSSLNTLYGTTGTADTTYFTNLLRWICDNYPSKQHYIYIGKANPNSVGVAIISIYDTSNKNATTGLPQYASGIYVRLSNAPINFGTSSYTFYSNTTISSASGVATSATKVNTNLVIKLNSGTTEGTNMFTFNGSAAKTINITPSAIGAAASSHSHSYLPLSGGTITGNLTIKSPTLTLNTTNTITSARSLRFANAKYVTGTNTSGTAYDVAGLSSANTINLGHASLTTVIRGSSVRLGSGSGTVVTSDQNLKTDIQDIDEKYIAFFKQLQPKTYKYKLGNAKRPHIGFIAQEVEQALNYSGLTTDDFAGICIEEVKYAEENDYDEFDDMNYAYKQGLEKIYSLRYEEFISLNTRMIQEVMTENEVLKSKVQEQDEIIKSQNERISNLKSEISELKSLMQQLLNK